MGKQIYKTLLNKRLVKTFNLGERMMRLNKNENQDLSSMVKIYSPLKTKMNRLKHGSYRRIKAHRGP